MNKSQGTSLSVLLQSTGRLPHLREFTEKMLMPPPNKRGPKLNAVERGILIQGCIAGLTKREIQQKFADAGLEYRITDDCLTYYRRSGEVQLAQRQAREEVLETGKALYHRQVQAVKDVWDTLERRLTTDETAGAEPTVSTLSVPALCDLARTILKTSEHLTGLLKDAALHFPQEENDGGNALPYEDDPDYNFHAVFNDMLEELIHADPTELAQLLATEATDMDTASTAE
jgi:hypothetical protein